MTRWVNYSILDAARKRWPHLHIRAAEGRHVWLLCGLCKKWRWALVGNLYVRPRGYCLKCALRQNAKEKRTRNNLRIERLLDRLVENKRTPRQPLTKKGYAHIWYDGKLKMLHRLVMERFLKRRLSESETVHHKNGKRADNRLKNLVVYRIHPAGISEKEMVDFLRNLGYHIRDRRGL